MLSGAPEKSELLRDRGGRFARRVLHDVAAEARLLRNRGRELVEAGGVEELLPARHPDLVVGALEEVVDAPFPPPRHDLLGHVEHVAQREHDARPRAMLAQEVESGEELTIDAPGHVVNDEHVGIEALGDRLDEIFA